MNTIWNDENRFSQEGYSSPTEYPVATNYKDLSLYVIDLAKAEARQESHLEWLWEEHLEARIAYEEEKAQRLQDEYYWDER